METLTVGSSELGHGINKSLMKVSCPSKARLWVSCENKAGIHTKTGCMDLFIGWNHSFWALNQAREHLLEMKGRRPQKGECKRESDNPTKTYLGLGWGKNQSFWEWEKVPLHEHFYSRRERESVCVMDKRKVRCFGALYCGCFLFLKNPEICPISGTPLTF